VVTICLAIMGLVVVFYNHLQAVFARTLSNLLNWCLELSLIGSKQASTNFSRHFAYIHSFGLSKIVSGFIRTYPIICILFLCVIFRYFVLLRFEGNMLWGICQLFGYFTWLVNSIAMRYDRSIMAESAVEIGTGNSGALSFLYGFYSLLESINMHHIWFLLIESVNATIGGIFIISYYFVKIFLIRSLKQLVPFSASHLELLDNYFMALVYFGTIILWIVCIVIFYSRGQSVEPLKLQIDNIKNFSESFQSIMESMTPGQLGQAMSISLWILLLIYHLATSKTQ
jgi:hypothetical protein